LEITVVPFLQEEGDGKEGKAVAPAETGAEEKDAKEERFSPTPMYIILYIYIYILCVILYI